MSEQTLQALLVEHVEKPESVLLLGALVAKSLLTRGCVSLSVNEHGAVEIADPTELYHDQLAEADALLSLTGNHGYTEDRLVQYLKKRDARKRALDGTNMRSVPM